MRRDYPPETGVVKNSARAVHHGGPRPCVAWGLNDGRSLAHQHRLRYGVAPCATARDGHRDKPPGRRLNLGLRARLRKRPRSTRVAREDEHDHTCAVRPGADRAVLLLQRAQELLLHLEPRKFDREIRPPLEASRRPMGVEGEVLTFHVAQFAKPLPRRRAARRASSPRSRP